MSERKFDYNNVGIVYNQMKNINDNIKNLLSDTDNEVHNKVDVCEEAIYGDLGNQLLLSWDNISSNFPNFVDNFENWSALVAKASGDYSQFEADVAAFKNANPLGVTSAGATQGAVATSSYNNSLTAEKIEELDAATVFYEPTGATYIDTGMVEYAKKHKTMNIVGDVLNVASIVLSFVQVGGAIKAATKVASPAVQSTALTVVSQNGDDVGTALVKAGASSTDDLGSAAFKAGASSTDDLGNAALKAGMSYTDDASGQAIKSVASKGGKIYTQPQQIYDDVVSGKLSSNEGTRLVNKMFREGGNVIDDAAGSTPAQKWMGDISEAGKGRVGQNIANSAAKPTSSASGSAARAAAGNPTGTSTSASTGAKTGWRQKWSDSRAGRWASAQRDKFNGTGFGKSVKASGEAATNRFNAIKGKVSGWGTSAKAGVQNGYSYVRNLNAANPTYKGKWATGAAGVNIVNIGYDSQETGYDPNVYGNQQNQSGSNNQTP